MTVGMIRAMCAMLGALAVASAAPAAVAGDPAAGRAAFNKCRACHTLGAAEPHRIGPNLHRMFGRRAGTADGFRYSAAMQRAGLVWTDETLAQYLQDPRGFIPGNRMAMPPMRDDDEIANLLAFLREATQ